MHNVHSEAMAGFVAGLAGTDLQNEPLQDATPVRLKPRGSWMCAGKRQLILTAWPHPEPFHSSR